MDICPSELNVKPRPKAEVAQWSEAQGYIINFITLKQTLNQEYSTNLKLTADGLRPKSKHATTKMLSKHLIWNWEYLFI